MAKILHWKIIKKMKKYWFTLFVPMVKKIDYGKLLSAILSEPILDLDHFPTRDHHFSQSETWKKLWNKPSKEKLISEFHDHPILVSFQLSSSLFFALCSPTCSTSTLRRPSLQKVTSLPLNPSLTTSPRHFPPPSTFVAANGSAPGGTSSLSLQPVPLRSQEVNW